jgi:hypothetical protein
MKIFTVTLKAHGEADVPRVPFSQDCPGGGIFELIHTSAQLKGAGGKVVTIRGLMETACPTECEKKFARSTYFRKKNAIDICPLQQVGQG